MQLHQSLGLSWLSLSVSALCSRNQRCARHRLVAVWQIHRCLGVLARGKEESPFLPTMLCSQTLPSLTLVLFAFCSTVSTSTPQMGGYSIPGRRRLCPLPRASHRHPQQQRPRHRLADWVSRTSNGTQQGTSFSLAATTRESLS